MLDLEILVGDACDDDAPGDGAAEQSPLLTVFLIIAFLLIVGGILAGGLFGPLIGIFLGVLLLALGFALTVPVT